MDDQDEAEEIDGHASCLTLSLFLFELVNEVQQVEEADPYTVAAALGADGAAQVRLAGPRSSDKDDVRPGLHEAALAQLPDPVLAHRRGRGVEALQILHY